MTLVFPAVRWGRIPGHHDDDDDVDDGGDDDHHGHEDDDNDHDGDLHLT